MYSKHIQPEDSNLCTSADSEGDRGLDPLKNKKI